MLSAAWLSIIHKNQGVPLLTSKSCDGTPLNVKQCSRVKLPSGHEVRSSGLAASEFLVKLQWVRALHPDGSHETGVLLQEAQPLIHGKKVPALVAACTKDWKTLRNCGHRGIALEHYVFDRCG